MKLLYTATMAAALLLLSSCSKKEDLPKPISPPPTSNATAPVPDVGKVDTVPTTADGYGSTPAAATADAMKTAILQVNGATIDTGSVHVKYGLDVTDGKDAVSLRATSFAESVAQKSGGAITNFKVLTVADPKSSGGQYKVTITANIAHFTAPADNKKIKVVVAPVRFDAASFVIGSETVPAQKVAENIREQVLVALNNTGRFSVLDREIGSDIDQELAMIKNGDAPRAETGKLGQAVTADVIWAGHIDTLAYNRHARKLATSDRELVSYSGGWAIAQKLVNVATRQVMTSDALHGDAPEISPTTMGAGIKSGQVLTRMEAEIASEIVASILARTFPITVVARDGNNVVLSQGGQSVKLGTRYALASMGNEMKDPQTGESLGRMEAACCEVVIDKVTPKLSYGHLENVKISLENIATGGLQVREQVKGVKVVVSTAETSKADLAIKETSTVQNVVLKRVSKKSVEIEGEAPTLSKEDGKW